MVADKAIHFDETRIRTNVPEAMRELPQWVCWVYAKRNGKLTKCPINPMNGSWASTTDHSTWGTFDTAIERSRKYGKGVGFVFTADDPFTGVDLDHCIDPQTGDIKAWARGSLSDLNSYCETSPSGTGVKVFVRASKSGKRCKTPYEDGDVEMYSHARFFTVTGARLTEFSAEVEKRQEQIDALYAMVFPKQKPVSPPTKSSAMRKSEPLSDDEIIKLASDNLKTGAKFSALWAGEWEGRYGSASEADSALIFRLVYYTRDSTQLDRLFRRSGLIREKWDKRRGQLTYGEMTIEKALQKVRNQYDPGKANWERKPSRCASIHDGPPLGTIEPKTNRLILATDRTLPTARAFISKCYMHRDGMTLRNSAGQFLGWWNNRYAVVEDGAIRNRLLPWLHEAVRMSFNSQSSTWAPEDFPANPTTMKAALESIKACTYLAASTASPCWLGNDADRPNPIDILPCRSALLHLPTMQVLPPTPLFFCVNALDYDHDSNAPPPAQWQNFLGQLFKDDLQSLELLQEWMGYCLTGDTSQHKMLIVVGPKRSGKGTIARVLRKLVGPGNVCGPTTSGLAGNFGLQPLLGKSLAIVSDARFAGENIQTVVERLLCISGEDTLTIDRKHLPSVTVKLPTRFVFLTNELPRLNDASGALAGRFVMLRLTESFYGREDLALTEKLLGELPGILNWAINGWQRLRERGHFVQPGSVQDALRDLEDLASPVGAFVRDWCQLGPDLRIGTSELYTAWQRWCEVDGRIKVMTKQLFGRNLMAVAPHVRTRCGTGSIRFYDGIALKESQS